MSIKTTEFNLPGQTAIYHGKVRDVYTINDKYLVMVATDRISAFDVILPEPIPYKGQVLNLIAEYFLNATKEIAPNWLLNVPDPRVSIGIKCEPVKIEMVIRGYLSGHAWREYKAGKRMICGVPMPDGMKENDKFPEPIITPTSKAAAGHDEDISREEILSSNIISPEKYQMMEDYTRKLFKKGSEMANERGLILVDTKYEFGLHEDKIILMDEIHTPDSSRYFYLDGYEQRQKNNEHQKQLSKEFVREWLIENGFMGKEGQVVPAMSNDWINTISERYIELYEKMTGDKFFRSPSELSVIEQNIMNGLRSLA
ncbi:MAG: phosphoribosylaminoimidazolesuccinocarboxamide synthase [Chitinophagales bacterium]